jgi:hypothetical protein
LALIVVVATVVVYRSAGTRTDTPAAPGTPTPVEADEGFGVASYPDFRIAYPAALKRETPPAGDRMVFLAEQPGAGGAPGTTLAVRRATRADADLATDMRAFDDLQAFDHPGRRRLAMRRVTAPRR